MSAQSSDGNVVARDVILGPCETPLVFLKHMSKHVDGAAAIDMAWAASPNVKHVILIRDPVKLISSWAGPTSPDGLEMSLEEVDRSTE